MAGRITFAIHTPCTTTNNLYAGHRIVESDTNFKWHLIPPVYSLPLIVHHWFGKDGVISWTPARTPAGTVQQCNFRWHCTTCYVSPRRWNMKKGANGGSHFKRWPLPWSLDRIRSFRFYKGGNVTILFLSYSSAMESPIRTLPNLLILFERPYLIFEILSVFGLVDIIIRFRGWHSIWSCGHYYKVQGLTHVIHMPGTCLPHVVHMFYTG